MRPRQPRASGVAWVLSSAYRPLRAQVSSFLPSVHLAHLPAPSLSLQSTLLSVTRATL